MNRLSEFFQEANGTLSATRLAFLAWVFVVLTIWGIDSFRSQKMENIPESVQVLIGVLMTGKVAQKFGEKPKPDTDEVRVVERQTQTASVNGMEKTAEREVKITQ